MNKSEQVSVILPVKFLHSGDEVTKITGTTPYTFKSELRIYSREGASTPTCIKGQLGGGFLLGADGSIISVGGEFLVKVTMDVTDLPQFGQDLNDFIMGED